MADLNQLILAIVFVIVPTARASWWHDPYVLANYSLLDAHVKKILPEVDFLPLADFFTAHPAAVRPFSESTELRNLLKSSPRVVSLQVQACARLEQLSMLLVAAPERPLSPEVSQSMSQLCSMPDYAKMLPRCPTLDAWKQGLLSPTSYKDSKVSGHKTSPSSTTPPPLTTTAPPPTPLSTTTSTTPPPSSSSPLCLEEDRLADIEAQLDFIQRLLIGLTCLLILRLATWLAYVAVEQDCRRRRRRRANNEEVPPIPLPGRLQPWKETY